MKIIKEILFWTWCLPQTLLGLILKLIFKGKKFTIQYFDKQYTAYNYTNKQGSISLGKYVLLTDYHKHSVNTVKHEFGHQIQSFILGPLYLIVIGLPSLLWAYLIQSSVNKRRKSKGKSTLSYYWFYTEKWANKLGGVNYRG